jgi:hypothetical protein
LLTRYVIEHVELVSLSSQGPLFIISPHVKSLTATNARFSQELKFGVEGRAALLAGVETLAKAVATTLGPKGRNVLIESSFGSPKITKGSSITGYKAR